MIPPPASGLGICVVIPAHDEEALIEACLGALAVALRGRADEAEVLLVLDACSDETEQRAAATAAREPALRLHVLSGPGRGAGAARALGMDVACERLLAIGRPGGLIASTDADTQVAPDWIERQLTAVAAGAEAIGGDILLEPASAGLLDPATIEQRRRRLATRRAALRGPNADRAEHPHFSGASLGVTARAYRAAGGMEPVRSLEDEGLARRLEAAGIPVHRLGAVRVTTSARTRVRAGRGLSTDLAVSEWMATRTWRAAEFDQSDLVAAKDRSVAVISLEHSEGAAESPPDSLEGLREAGLVDEIIAAPRESDDRDAGRGEAMRHAASGTEAEILVFPDAGEDAADAVIGLLGAMWAAPGVRFVKGVPTPSAVDHPATGAVDALDELVARPLVNLDFPHLAGFAGFVHGGFAIDRFLFLGLAIPAGHGADLAILIDAWRLRGLEGLAQVALGVPASPRRANSPPHVVALELMIAARNRAGRDAIPGDGDPPPSTVFAASASAMGSTHPLRCSDQPPLMPEQDRLAVTPAG